VGQVYLQYVHGPLAEDKGWGIYSLFVHPLFRGLGIGQRLMRDQLAWAHQQGIAAVRLYAAERDAPSMALFRKLGFRRIRIPKIEERLDREAGPGGRSLILMVKELEETG
jgi:ribosomal protein S18 acetylase RimI-like enzyme